MTSFNLIRLPVIVSAFALLAGGAAFAAECAKDKLTNDYPTETRADYVYGCMLANGQTRDVLAKCSCSMDVIATVLPFKEYEEAETIMAVRQRGGESVTYMYAPAMREKVNNLKRAQIEGEMRCF